MNARDTTSRSKPLPPGGPADVNGDVLVLRQKLQPPPLAAHLLPRTHLLDRLDAGLSGKVTLVSAPAGSGKTTLLSAWMRLRRDTPVSFAWLSLDPADNDLSSFLAHLIGAARSIVPDIPFGQALDSAALLVALADRMAARGGRLALILDDYDRIRAAAVHDAVSFFLEALPANAHLVVATRTEPPLPLARLQGRGQLARLRYADLCLSRSEAEVVLQALGPEAPPGVVDQIMARTEGWLAGVMMEARALSSQAAEGGTRSILDYFQQEILQPQPPELQEFFLRTAILDKLTAPLCDRLLEPNPGGGSGSRSQAILEGAESANLFLRAIDAGKEWYRYHPLFGELLRHRLEQTRPELAKELHRRAAGWYEEAALLDDAIDHALAAGDVEGAASLMERALEDTWKRGDLTTFVDWLEALPRATVQARPRLRVFYALAHLLRGHSLSLVESYLGGGDEAGDPLAAVGLSVASLLLDVHRGRLQECIAAGRHLLDNLHGPAVFPHSLVSHAVGLAYLESGDLAAAGEIVVQGVRMGREAGCPMGTVLALCSLAHLSTLQGRLHEARARYEQALEWAVDDGGRPSPVAGLAHIGLGRLLVEWDELQPAVRHLEQGIALAGSWSELATLPGHAGLGTICAIQGDYDGALQHLEKAEQIAIGSDLAGHEQAVVRLLKARIWLAQGNIEATAGWAEERNLAATPGEAEADLRDTGRGFVACRLRTQEYLLLATLFHATKQETKACDLLERLIELGEASGDSWLRLPILVNLALASPAGRRGMEALRRALSLAQPVGWVRAFLDAGDALIPLLRQAAEQDVFAGFATGLVERSEASGGRDALAPASPPLPVAPADHALVQSLTAREFEVLQFLATPLPPEEIAARLFVAVSTVRSHTKSIYSKLQVHRRLDAVKRARELELL